jgi:nucleoside-diphosphate-sugar epimerase
MKVFITGASGFLGQYVVAEALRQQHNVVAMVRPQTKVEKFSWHHHPNLSLARVDLRQIRELANALEGVDAVIHLAAVKSGDFYDQFAGTVIATENLISVMSQLAIHRLIAISTFSVYDYLAKPTNSLIDELFPIEDDPLSRDEYAQTKLIQEQLYRAFEKEQSGAVTILRPGMIYGRDNLWNPCLGSELGSSSFLRFGAYGKMPLTYVENCAEAVVNSLIAESSIGKTLNIVDDELPTKKAFSKLLQVKDPQSPKVIAVNWYLAKSIADLAWFVNQKFLGGKAKLPGILVPAKLQGRFKPFRYSNEKAKKYLNWEPRYTLSEAVDRSLSEADLLSLSETEQVTSPLTTA